MFPAIVPEARDTYSDGNTRGIATLLAWWCIIVLFKNISYSWTVTELPLIISLFCVAYIVSVSGGVGCVVLATNLNTEALTPNDLQTLFGIYGNVMRVQILAKVCPDMAIMFLFNLEY